MLGDGSEIANRSIGEKIKEQLKTSLQEKGKPSYELISNEKNNRNGIYLFFSFDLVNSTIYKSKDKENWTKLFQRFYELVDSEMDNSYKNTSLTLWRYIGDEVIFYLKVSDLDQVIKCPAIVSTISKVVVDQLHTEFEKSRGLIYSKSTIWMADVEYQGSKSTESKSKSEPIKKMYNNVATIDKTKSEWFDNDNIDFLGPEIDLGFRLSKFSRRNSITMSVEVAYIIYKYDEQNVAKQKIKIVSLEKLKGIWENRWYPIIWYHNYWDNLDFEYDEHLDDKLIEKISDPEKLKDLLEVEKILKDTRKIEYVEKLIKDINESEEFEKDNKVYDKEKLSEIHLVAICINEEQKILLAKRSATKKVLPSKWDFGCAQLHVEETISECLQRDYNEDFNINIEASDDTQVYPISIYNFKNAQNRIIPGLISVIKANGSIELNGNSGYSEARWFTKEEALGINALEAVDGFKNNIELAYKQLAGIARE